jgi:hypothetical protein
VTKLRILLAVLASAVIITGTEYIATDHASATTLTCTNIAAATASPFGCGGLQSAGASHGLLDLAHTASVYNALVTVQPDASVTSEDWTAFKVAGLSGAGGLGVYVAMDTPDGLIPSWINSGVTHTNSDPAPGETFTAGPNTLCISLEHAAAVPGTNGKFRWWAVMRQCSTNGTFTYGTATSSGTVTAGLANQYQAWAPVISSDGYLLVNTWLHNHANVNDVLDITANGPAGSVVQAYPENDQINEQWGLIGCTLPASQLGGVTSPPYVNCP